MNYKNSTETRRACASNYLALYYTHYPKHTLIREKAKQDALRLGGTTISPKGTTLFYVLKGLLGWKLAKRFENFYYRNGLNRAALKNKLKI